LHFQQTARGDFFNHEIGTAFALLAGVTFKVPSLGSGDQLMLEASYCDGVSHGCGGTGGGAANTSTEFERDGQYLEGLRRTDFDAYLVPDGSGGWDFENTKWMGVAAQYRHYWAPLWRTNIHGSYQKIKTPDIAKTMDLDDDGRGDARVWDIGANLIWGKSRQTAEIGVEVLYKSVKQDLPNGQTAADLDPGIDVNPSGWTVNAFIQRAW
jgi:hypothetical protein